MKKLLVLANYYYPENASVSNLYTELCEYAKDEYEVNVICEIPCYKGVLDEKWKDSKRFTIEKINEINVLRVRVSEFSKGDKIGRIKHILSYFFNVFLSFFKLGKHDVILAVSQPPILGGLLGWLAKVITKGKLIYNIQDFNPEQVTVTNYSSNKIVIKTMKFIDNFICRHSDHIVVVSNDMRKTLKLRLNNKKIPSNSVISNWVDPDKIKPIQSSKNPLYEKYNIDKNDFLIVYAGNMGYLQNLKTVIDAAEYLKNNNKIKFILFGDGAEKNSLIELIKDKNLSNIQVYNLETLDNVKYVYALGNVGLVSIGKNVTTCSMPSKTWNILSASKPLVCQVDVESELTNLINQNKLGFAVPPNNHELMAQAILKLYSNSELTAQIGQGNRVFVFENCSKEICCSKYLDVFNKLISKRK